MVEVIGLKDIGQVRVEDNIGRLIVKAVHENQIVVKQHDVFCVASKIVSITENREIMLKNVAPMIDAQKIHQRIPRKDARLIQLMINETGDTTAEQLTVTNSFIGGQMPNGLFLTSAGVDKIDDEKAILLPEFPDISAQKIALTLTTAFGVPVSVVITDSDGRPDKKGATQIAIGVYGLKPLRETTSPKDMLTKPAVETLCDMVAAAAGLEMGQRDAGIPVAIVSGLKYQFDTNAKITDALN